MRHRPDQHESSGDTAAGDAARAATAAATRKERPLAGLARGTSKRNMLSKLAQLTHYDLFWAAVGIFVLRILYFLATNGMPHKPSARRK